MEYDEAKRLLLLHGSGTWEPQEWYGEGFLGQLRPYSGLHEHNFHAVMEYLFVVGEHFHVSESVDRDLIESLWSMISLARVWGIEPGGMLKRNNLITPGDAERLAKWIDTVEQAVIYFLRGCPPSFVVEGYAQYVLDAGPGANIAFFLPLMKEFIADPESSDCSVVAEALAKLGPIAKPVLPALQEALKRTYNWYEPVEMCTAEMHDVLNKAIQAITKES